MPDTSSLSLSAQDSLVALMIAVSASDEDIRTAELVKIESALNLLPVFSGYDNDRLKHSEKLRLYAQLLLSSQRAQIKNYHAKSESLRKDAEEILLYFQKHVD